MLLIFLIEFISIVFSSPSQVKARLQDIRAIPLKSPPNYFNTLLRQPGWYRGFGAVILGGTPGTVLYLTSYEILKDSYDGNQHCHSLGVHYFLAGMLAEAIACIIYVPVDVIKERLQVSGT